MNANEVKKGMAFCLRLYALLPELRTELINYKPEWNDEKALNETLAACVKTIESINAGTLRI